MMTLDYTFEKRLELQREEAAEEGRIEGEKFGMQEKLRELVYKKLLKNKSLEQIADELEESTESILPIYEKLKLEMDSSDQ